MQVVRQTTWAHTCADTELTTFVDMVDTHEIQTTWAHTPSNVFLNTACSQQLPPDLPSLRCGFVCFEHAVAPYTRRQVRAGQRVRQGGSRYVDWLVEQSKVSISMVNSDRESGATCHARVVRLPCDSVYAHQQQCRSTCHAIDADPRVVSLGIINASHHRHDARCQHPTLRPGHGLATRHR